MRQFNSIIGCIAGLILSTCWRFVYLSSHARIDMLFTFFITLAFVSLWELSQNQNPTIRPFLKGLAGIAIGLSVLTKGPLGYIFPLLAIFFFNRSYKSYSVPWAIIILVPLGMAGVWLCFGLIDGGQDFSTMIYQETIGRVSGNEIIQVHRKPFFYYIPQILGGMAPWSLFLPFAIWYGIKNKRQNNSWGFCTVAFFTLFIFLSFFPGKRGDYLLPLYPMGAIILAVFFSEFSKNKHNIKWGVFLPAWIIMLLMIATAFILILGALLPQLNLDNFSTILNSRDRWMAQLLYDKHRPSGLLIALGAWGMLIFSQYIREALKKYSGNQVATLITGWAFLLFIFVHGPAARTVNKYSSFRPFAEVVKKMRGDRIIYNFGRAPEDLLYYLDFPVKEVYGDTKFQSLASRSDVILLIKKFNGQTLFKSHLENKIVHEIHVGFEPYIIIKGF